MLVTQTARFTASFLRWIEETQAPGGLSYPRLRLLQALQCGGRRSCARSGTQLGATRAT